MRTFAVEEIIANYQNDGNNLNYKYYVIKVISICDNSFVKCLARKFHFLHGLISPKISYINLVFMDERVANSYLLYLDTEHIKKLDLVSYNKIKKQCEYLFYNKDQQKEFYIQQVRISPKSELAKYLDNACEVWEIRTSYGYGRQKFSLHWCPLGEDRYYCSDYYIMVWSSKFDNLSELERWTRKHFNVLLTVEHGKTVSECITHNGNTYIYKPEPSELDKTRNQLLQDEITRSENYISFLKTLMK